MILKFRCNQFPNSSVGGVKFVDGYAEVDSIHSVTVNALMSSPFVEILSNLAPTIENSISEEEVPVSTFKNRLQRQNKVGLIKIAEEMGIPIGDRSLPNSFYINEILKFKYPEYKEE